ncbi:M14 family metallopeptidase [Adlercreutzia sp. ZJ242]|uniref:M14 family metallopeptidase n=1 Tax=Adlercreutzia sp. ZJ242 TaxID=2709409 RepID=UPI0013EB214B|nr:M14 family metallopeptidase [Adlercreutzia sp. ZJ242]
METLRLFELDTPYRERMTIEAYAFGPADAATSVAVVGAMRGNEVQQTYICASVVKRLQEMEREGALTGDVRVTVIPTVNSFSMNIAHRFWPMDNTDVNRMFPGYDQGETTQRIAAGLFRAIEGCTYGIQLCSFYLPGEFEPHVRVTDTGAIDLARSWELAKLFRFPYAMLKEPAPFDTTTLNYNWQVWDTYAFSLYSPKTERIDEESAAFVVDCIMRFLYGVGAVSADMPPRCATRLLRESDLVNVRTTRAGFFKRAAYVASKVRRGDVLAEILSTQDCSVLETLLSPCDGTVFFRHGPAMVNGDTIAFKIAPEK